MNKQYHIRHFLRYIDHNYLLFIDNTIGCESLNNNMISMFVMQVYIYNYD